MVNKRSFLIGLGAGIIIGALLLELFYLGENSQQNLNEIGRQLEQSETGIPPGTDNDAAEPGADEEPIQQEQPSVDQEEADQDETTDQSTQTEEASAEPGEERLITIVYGASLTETAELLAESNIISGTTLFIEEMKAAGKKVRAGSFLFREMMGEEAAIKIVTGTPLTPAEVERYTTN